MQQENSILPQTPGAPQKPKRRPEPSEGSLQNPGTPKKSRGVFSPQTPAVSTPGSSNQPTHQSALTSSLAVQSQLGSTIVVFPESEADEYDYIKRKQIKRPVPATAQANTYRGLTQHLLALLRSTRENSSFKLAQLKGLTQTLSRLLHLLSEKTLKPEKISKVKKITLLLNDFIETNLSPEISADEFKKNSEAFYLTLRFNQDQLAFLTHLLLHLNHPANDNNDDSLQFHINRTTSDIAQVNKLIRLLEKNSQDFQQNFFEYLQKRLNYFDIKLQILNKYLLPLKNEAERHSVNCSALEYELSKEEASVKKLLALKKIQRIREQTLTTAQENVISIQKELEAVESKANDVYTLQNSFTQCLPLSSTNHETYQKITAALKVNTDQLNTAVNTLLNNGDDILTLEEMQPSPQTPKYVSPVARVALTPNTETKLFIQTLKDFVKDSQRTVQAEENAHAQENSPIPVQEVPAFAEAFPELQQQKAQLESYARELAEDTAEYTLVHCQIDLIAQHIASGIALLQQNHQLLARLAQQKKAVKEKTPFKIHSLLQRKPQTPLGTTTPLHTKKRVDMEFVGRFSPPQLTAQKALSFDAEAPFIASPVMFDDNKFTARQEKPENPAVSQSPEFPSTQLVPDEEVGSPPLPNPNAAKKMAVAILGMLKKQLQREYPQKNYRVHEVLGDGECGLTAFGITRDYAHELLGKNIQRVKHLLFLAIEEALLTLPFQEYLEAIEINPDDEDQIVQAYIDFDVRDRQIDHGWSHPAVLQALAEIQGIRLRIWRLDERDNLIPHRRTNEYDYAEHNPEGATQITDLLFINGNHFNRIEFEPEVPQANPAPLQFFAAAPERSPKRARAFYLSADEAINQFKDISIRLKDGLREYYRIFTTEQRLDLENIRTLFNDATASLEKLSGQVNDEDVINVFQKYIGKIEALNEEAKAFSPKEYLEKAYTNFVGPLENKQDNRRSASPPRL